MVVPIIAGLGITVAALMAKTTIAACGRYRKLTPQMIAAMNGIKVSYRDDTNNLTIYDELRRRFPNSGFEERMTEREALLILGIEEHEIDLLDSKMVKDRYRKLMIQNHPDKNGSQYLSQKINQAKDVIEKSYLLKK